MAAGYKLLFWGIIIATVNISVGSITIFPAFMGFILAYFGLQDLETSDKEGNYFIPKVGLILLIVLTFGKSAVGLIVDSNIEEIPVLIFFPAIVSMIELITFHKIIESAAEYFDVTDLQHTVPILISKDKTYLILTGISLFIIVVSLAINYELTLFLGMMVGILARINLLTILYMLRKEIERLEQPDISQFTDQI